MCKMVVIISKGLCKINENVCPYVYIPWIKLDWNYGLFLISLNFRGRWKSSCFWVPLSWWRTGEHVRSAPPPTQHNTTQLHDSLCVKPSGVPSRQGVVYTVNNPVILNGPQLEEELSWAPGWLKNAVKVPCFMKLQSQWVTVWTFSREHTWQLLNCWNKCPCICQSKPLGGELLS